MDNELMEMIVRLKCESKILRGLVDSILDSTYLSYNGEDLRVGDGDRILTVLNTFFGDEVNNRIEQLKAESVKEESENG